MSRDDLTRLKHMLDAAKEAIAFTEGRSREHLNSDRLLNLALVRLLEVIGEAARGVSLEFRDTYPVVPWKKMSGMRDRLIHGYFDVNLDVVWRTVTQDLPSLVSKLQQIIPPEKN